MPEIYVDRLAHALGSVTRSVLEAEHAGDLGSDGTALRAAGFERHHVCAADESAYDLARRAFEASGVAGGEVDCILYATCLPQNGNDPGPREFAESRDVKDLMRFPASRLQAEFGMHRAIVIGLNQQACTGMLGSIRLARNMLLAEPEMNSAICISADRFPPGARYEQAYNLISDGAAVCRVSREAGGFRLLGAHQITNGAMLAAGDDETVGAFFNYSHRLIAETLARCELSLEQIDWIVPQNLNRKAWQVLASLLQLPKEKAWFESIADCGHVISADNVINLAQLDASGQLRTGDRVLTFMAGFGSNWQCLVLEKA